MDDSSPSKNALKQEVEELQQKLEAARREMLGYQQKEPDTSMEKERLIIAAENSEVGLFNWDLETDQVVISPHLKTELGLSTTLVDNVRSLLPEYIYTADLARLITLIEDVHRGNLEKFSLEYRLKDRKGGYNWVNLAATTHKDQRGKALFLTGTIQKLSRERQEMLTLLHGEVAQLIGRFKLNTDDCTLLECNSKAEKLLGNPKLGEKLKDCFLERIEYQALKQDLIEQGKIEDSEVKLNTDNKFETWGMVSAIYLPEENAADFVLIDISRTRYKLKELTKINSDLDNFVYHSSHDLRAPLKSILGLLHILRREKEALAQKECIDMIEGSIHRLDLLVNDLLTISRNGRIDDKPKEVSMLVEINHAITSFASEPNARNIEIIPIVLQHYPFFTDITRLRIILNNLLSNAVKYRSYERDQSYIKIGIEVTEEKATLLFEDNGIGISKSNLEKVFEMFYRGSLKSQGSGLGLYIVKNVVDKMNGTIEVNSKLNQGTSFKIEIPNLYYLQQNDPK